MASPIDAFIYIRYLIQNYVILYRVSTSVFQALTNKTTYYAIKCNKLYNIVNYVNIIIPCKYKSEKYIIITRVGVMDSRKQYILTSLNS